MKLHSKNVINGYLEDKFGYRDDQKPNRSFHLTWSDLPKDAKTLALIFVDYDAIPVCGFPWIHWACANIDPKLNELPENASAEMNLLQGVNSRISPFLQGNKKISKEDAIGFAGCAPPDKTHTYTLYVYALDTKLNLAKGFYANELIKAIEGHILAQTKLEMMYKPRK
jgi:hypothetical protein